MTIITLILREFFGMFVDDEFLALAVLGLIGLSAVAAFWIALPALVVGGVLLGGCVALLMASALRARKR
jgi:hypothetical protein